MLSGLNGTALALAIYASPGGLPASDARLASGCWPGSAGWDWLPTGFQRTVSETYSLHLFLPSQTFLAQCQFIDEAATLRTIAEVGGDVRQFRLGELAQGQRKQRFVTRMVRGGLDHDKPGLGSSDGQTTTPLCNRETQTDGKPYTIW
jgi:hypothetical protein